MQVVKKCKMANPGYLAHYSKGRKWFSLCHHLSIKPLTFRLTFISFICFPLYVVWFFIPFLPSIKGDMEHDDHHPSTGMGTRDFPDLSKFDSVQDILERNR
jgi:hypothetical protein